MNRAIGIQVRTFLYTVVLGLCCPPVNAHAQGTLEQVSDGAEPIEEIVVVVDRDGKPIDVDALRLEEAKLRIIQDFELEHTKLEQELWRLKLRSAINRNTSRIAWGYDAQSEAAKVWHSRGSELSIDRVKPATVISIRF